MRFSLGNILSKHLPHNSIFLCVHAESSCASFPVIRSLSTSGYEYFGTLLEILEMSHTGSLTNEVFKSGWGGMTLFWLCCPCWPSNWLLWKMQPQHELQQNWLSNFSFKKQEVIIGEIGFYLKINCSQTQFFIETCGHVLWLAMTNFWWKNQWAGHCYVWWIPQAKLRHTIHVFGLELEYTW